MIWQTSTLRKALYSSRKGVGAKCDVLLLRCFKSEVCHMHLPRALRRNATVLIQVTSLKKLRAMAYRSKILHPSWIAPRQNHRRISIFDRIVDQKPSSIWFQNLLMRSSLLIIQQEACKFFPCQARRPILATLLSSRMGNYAWETHAIPYHSILQRSALQRGLGQNWVF